MTPKVVAGFPFAPINVDSPDGHSSEANSVIDLAAADRRKPTTAPAQATSRAFGFKRSAKHGAFELAELFINCMEGVYRPLGYQDPDGFIVELNQISCGHGNSFET
ncbi:hypothetical protein [Oryzibacter oryziterrae]|uniref:hypothetical protein n=1 Tax=Oryzibacter oryziterrae TaxID=2766474 RepID=UPI001F2075E2|nr:hypothetical protein [Oryzibacter oryziterrae]